MKLLIVLSFLVFFKGGSGQLHLDYLPVNTVALVGSTVTLRCAVAHPDEDHSLQWTEYAYTEVGGPISDNNDIGFHPERDRYAIQNDSPGQYFLVISGLVMADGGIYSCHENFATPLDKRRHGMSLTIIAEPTNCTTTIGMSGVVLDESYQTNDCIIQYQGGLVPNMTWTGPPGYRFAYSANDNLAWTGMEYNVSRDMDTRAHQCTTNFTAYFLPVDGDTADNVPTYTYTHQSRQMFVYWGPRNLTASPIKPTYVVGDTLTCTSDAWPPAGFLWQNMRTNQISSGATVTILASWEGFNQSLRCEARNEIEGTIYSNNVFVAVDVPTPTTTEPPTTPTTTTPPPAVADCTDHSGAWVSTFPTIASLCLRVDHEASGAMTGLLKNVTDTFWVDIVGRTQLDKFDQLGFNGIWPLHFGVSSFVGECHRCFGVEQILINVATRQYGTTCGVEGLTQYTTQYQFYRSSTLQCPNIPTFQ